MSKKLDNLDEIYANSIIMKNRKEVDEIVSRLYNYEPVKKINIFVNKKVILQHCITEKEVKNSSL